MKSIIKIIKVVLAMGGVLLDKFNLMRVMLIMVIIPGYFLHIYLNNVFGFMQTVIYFFTIFIIRYLFLFNSFTNNGISKKLISRYGEKKGYDVYQFITALMFFFSAAAYSLLITKSAGFIFYSLGIMKPLVFTAGILIFTIGMIVNTWSAVLIGIDIYYYKDLFLGKFISEFKKEGPYMLFRNPMYGIGQASGYGTALMYGSVIGIVAICLNQLMMYIFYLTIEKPHINRLFKQFPSEGI